jgi:CRISPR-associated protein Cmr2
MTAHLLAIAVGPVQEFIAAARRTRDLWFGSYLLSEISKATAKAVHDHGGTLIFPAPGNDADLDCDSRLIVANVIVAELSGSDPAAVAREAKEAARSRWRSFADQVFAKYQRVIQVDIWNDQVDDVIEFYAAWRTCSPHTYQTDRAALMRLLGARKRCRDFPPAKGRAGVPKSSLDGLRESVLRPPRDWPEGSRRRLHLQMGEQLDVVGIVKRTWMPVGGTPRYPSVARVAADPWLRGLPPARLDALVKACRDLGSNVIHEIDTSDGSGHPRYAAFPFEGTAVFRSRHRDICEEAELSDSDLKPLAQALVELTREYGEPSPYLGVLVADGDQMGLALSALRSPDEHRAFSQALASFAADARRIIDAHNGVLVYAGGDDVLAFVPVDRCLGCARALHDRFGDALKSWSTKTRTELSLSVGLAIARFMEPLEDLLGYGRAAEKHAKRPRPEDGGQGDRNGLAVHVVTRGGDPLAVRANWSAAPDEHLNRLAELIAAEAVSGRIAYDMHKIADVYESWPKAAIKDAIQRDTLSVMQGKQPRGASRMHDIEGHIRARVTEADTLRGLANDLLVAKAIGPASAGCAAGADSS